MSLLNNRIKLICIPYAGSNSSYYYQWKKYLHNSIKLIPVELAGRGKRFNSSYYNSIADAVEDIYYIYKDEFSRGSFSFFGHSMGSLIVYELVRRLEPIDINNLIHIFFSGMVPPHIKRQNYRYKLSDNELLNVVNENGGTHNEILNNKELMELLLPIIRADYKIVDMYEHKHTNTILPCEISVFFGKADKEVLSTDLNQWNRYTMQKCNFYEFEGNHFFINDYVEKIVGIINSKLCGA